MIGLPSYEVRARSSAPPEKVFALLADGAGWSQWAGAMIVRSWWEREGTPAPGGVGAIRRLGLGRIGSSEEIVAYDPPHHMAYTLLRGMPVRDYRADVWVEPDGDGSTIRWAGSFTPSFPGLGAGMNLFFRSAVGSFARRLAARAEHA